MVMTVTLVPTVVTVERRREKREGGRKEGRKEGGRGEDTIGKFINRTTLLL
jgi:hypothetical protein